MNTSSRLNGFGALFAGWRAALQWRLLLLWMLAMLVPTLLIALPTSAWLQAQFGHSVHASDVAAGRNLPLLLDGLLGIGESGSWLGSSAALAVGVAILLSPWLNGMVIAAIRSGRHLGFGELIHGGLSEYGRMFRTLLWSLLPLGVAIAIGAWLTSVSGKKADTAILASDVEGLARVVFWGAIALFVFAHATVEAGRGWFGADVGLRSAIRAWWRGVKLFRRPVAVLAVYLGTAITGYGLAALLGVLRLQFNGASAGGFAFALVLTQLVVIALVWGRIARLYGMARLAADAMSPSQAPTPVQRHAVPDDPTPAKAIPAFA